VTEKQEYWHIDAKDFKTMSLVGISGWKGTSSVTKGHFTVQTSAHHCAICIYA